MKEGIQRPGKFGHLRLFDWVLPLASLGHSCTAVHLGGRDEPPFSQQSA